MAEQSNVTFLMQAIVERTVTFFREDLHINIHRVTCSREDVQKLQPRHLTSLIAMEGSMRLYLAFSFDKPLIEHAFEVYIEDIEVAEDERERYIEETAGDIINIIAGNATGSLPSEGPAVSISPPVVISEAKSIFRYKEAQFYTACLETDYGKMDIYCIGPKKLFDGKFRSLSYRK